MWLASYLLVCYIANVLKKSASGYGLKNSASAPSTATVHFFFLFFGLSFLYTEIFSMTIIVNFGVPNFRYGTRYKNFGTLIYVIIILVKHDTSYFPTCIIFM